MKSLNQNTALKIKLPTVGLVPNTTLLNINQSTAYARGNLSDINPNEWANVIVDCDFHNNTYSASINGISLVTGALLFDKLQKDFRNVMVYFDSNIAADNYVYIDDVKISDRKNKVLKFYGGTVINDTKLRIQTTMSRNKAKEYYFKYRFYLNEGFERLADVANNMSSYWLMLGEFFDGSCWAWTGPEPNYTSRVSMGIDKPAGPGAPLKFQVHHQHAKLDEPKFGPTIWTHKADVEVPVCKWVTIEIYIKQGLGSDPDNGGGKYYMYLTGEDGVRQTVFEINDSTYNENEELDGLEHAYPFKFYGNRNIFSSLESLGLDMQIYYDDFEVRTTLPMPEPVVPNPPSVVADDLNNIIIGLDLNTMEYSLSLDNGNSYGEYISEELPFLGGSKMIKVRFKAQGQTPAGEDIVLSFTPNAGDINADGYIDILDAVMAGEIIVGHLGYTPEQIARAKVSSKTELTVDISDLILLVERVVGGTEIFPVDSH